LETLLVKGRAPKTGYSREAFGPSWADTDYNGCDTRNDMLRRDLTEVVSKPGTDGCLVLEGRLSDPYSGELISFVRGEGTSDDVQIDHVVSLSNAWQTGMFQRGPEERRIFANDPLNLLAVQGWLNQQKGDGDAATWLPPLKSYRCEFVARQIAVKAAYRLWLTPPEKQAMLRILRTCPEQPLPYSATPSTNRQRMRATGPASERSCSSTLPARNARISSAERPRSRSPRVRGSSSQTSVRKMLSAD
jgi:hypothetical protein